MPTEADKLHLVQQVAASVARDYRVADPAELWGVGWVACERAMRNWNGKGALLGRIRVWVTREMEREASNGGRRRREMLTGTKRVDGIL